MKILLWAFVLFHATCSLGAIYKCTDANGHVIYSDTACNAKINSQSIEMQPLAVVKAERPFLSRMADKFKNFFQDNLNAVQKTSAGIPSASANKSLNYKCDGRSYCSQMRSCEEATFFINNCPDTKMDGNNDGIPCEKQWCR